MAKSTQYATLSNSGRAVLSERMMVYNPRYFLHSLRDVPLYRRARRARE